MKMNSMLLTLGAMGAAVALTLVLKTAEAADAVVASTNTDAQIQQLMAMSGPERRAYFKKLPVGQRGQLWMAMKRMKANKSVSKGGDANARSVKSIDAKNVAAAKKSAPGTKSVRAIGTIQYDQGAFTTSFGTGGGRIIGNRFDTHTGLPVAASGTVSNVQAVVVPGPAQTTSSAGFVLLGPQTGGGGANAIFSSFTAATGATATVNFTGLGVNYTGSSFYVLFGDFASSYIPVFGTGTALGQGHHAVAGYTGGMGPNITATGNLGGNLNAFIRAGGNIVPVELMNWSVD
jgi:hypothetical protein